MSLTGIRLRQWIVADPWSADVIVDLSNVCRSMDLGPGCGAAPQGGCAHLDRLETLIQHWGTQMSSEGKFYLIADRSLGRVLCSPMDRELLKNLEAEQLVRTVPYADPSILSVAGGVDAWVLSNDWFRAFRREDWVRGNPLRFVRWEQSVGVLTLLQGLPVVPEHEVTSALEQDAIKARLGAPQAPALVRNWQCVALDCVDGGGLLVSLPELREGIVVCPTCRGAVKDAGPRTASVELRITCRGSGSALAGIIMNDQTRRLVGRGQPGIVLPRRSAGLVSREHLEVSLSGRQLQVKDCYSQNGSSVRRWNPALRRLGRPEQLVAGRWYGLGLGDELNLSDVVCLRRSGLKFPIARESGDDRMRQTELTRMRP